MSNSPLERFRSMSTTERDALRHRWTGYQADPRPGHHDLTTADAEILTAIVDTDAEALLAPAPTSRVTITIAVDGEEFETITVDPSTLISLDRDGEHVDLMGTRRGNPATFTLLEIVEQACKEGGRS